MKLNILFTLAVAGLMGIVCEGESFAARRAARGSGSRPALAVRRAERIAERNSPEHQERRQQFWLNFAAGLEGAAEGLNNGSSYDWGTGYGTGGGTDTNWGLKARQWDIQRSINQPYLPR